MDKTLFVLPPNIANSASNAAVASQLIEHLGVDGQTSRLALQENLLPGRTIGLSIGQNGRWKAVGSATFPRFAYLALVRLFFRSKFGLAIEKPSSGQRSPTICRSPSEANLPLCRVVWDARYQRHPRPTSQLG
jgi:hypothetical protein